MCAGGACDLFATLDRVTFDVHLKPLAEALRGERDALVARWIEAYRDSVLRLPRPFDEAGIRHFCVSILESLADSLTPARTESPPRLVELRPGHPELREVEKSVSFIGGRLATGTTSGFDVAALILGLRDVLAPYVDGEALASLGLYVEWLSVLAVDSFCSARTYAERERVRDELEEGTPVVQVVPELPAAMLVGNPDGGVLDSIFARLILLTVRVGAPCAIVDATGLSGQDSPGMLLALDRFLRHRKVSGKVEVLAVGLDKDPEQRWLETARAAGTSMLVVTHFDRAVDRGLKVAGYRLVRS